MYDKQYNVAPRLHRCLQKISSPDGDVFEKGCIMTMDTEREKEIGLGTLYPYGKLAPGECIINSFWHEEYGLGIGDQVQISLYIETLENIVSLQIYNPIAEREGWEQA